MSISNVLGQWFDDIVGDEITNFSEGSEHTFAIYDTSTLKDYMEEKVEIHVHFLVWIDGASTVANYYSLTFNKSCMDVNGTWLKDSVNNPIGHDQGMGKS